MEISRATIYATSEDRAQHLTEKLAGYYLLFQKCSDRVKQEGHTKTDLIYNEAYKEWRSDPSNPLVGSPRGDEAKSDEYFVKWDHICASEP